MVSEGLGTYFSCLPYSWCHMTLFTSQSFHVASTHQQSDMLTSPLQPDWGFIPDLLDGLFFPPALKSTSTKHQATAFRGSNTRWTEVRPGPGPKHPTRSLLFRLPLRPTTFSLPQLADLRPRRSTRSVYVSEELPKNWAHQASSLPFGGGLGQHMFLGRNPTRFIRLKRFGI